LGRFLSVDPEEGDSADEYDYTSANPINETDLDGKGLWGWIKKTAKKAAKMGMEEQGGHCGGSSELHTCRLCRRMGVSWISAL
jgi:hypothetical protein